MSGPGAGGAVKRYTCPTCKARVGDPCTAVDRVGRRRRVELHAARIAKAKKAARQRPAGRPAGASVSAIPTPFETNRGRH